MNLLFCCHDFRRENLRLMPWRYIHEVVKGLAENNHRVTVVSLEDNGSTGEEDIDLIAVRRFDKKGIFRERAFTDLARTADCIIWSSSPATIFYRRMIRKLERPIILLFTGPFYSRWDIVRAQINGVPIKQLATHYKNVIVPLHFTASLVKAPFVRSAVVLSERNARIMGNYGCNDKMLAIVPPGYDGVPGGENLSVQSADTRESLCLPKDPKIVTYFGSLYEIRGIDLLLEAFSWVSSRTDGIILMILARTEKMTEIVRLERKVAKRGIADRTLIIQGFLEKEKVIKYLRASDIVALPFVLVPSDMPLGALEAMAVGKPVITADIDGMREMVAGRGLVVPPGDASALADAVFTLSRDSRLYETCRQNCQEYMNSYPSWKGIVERFDAVIQQSV